MNRISSLFCLIFILIASGIKAQSDFLDQLEFGNKVSESQHAFLSGQSKIITGGLNQQARVLLPPETPSWSGGKITFTIKVNPVKQNYITTKFWGDDTSVNRLYFVCGDKQIGSRHLGDVDMLDIGSDFPFYNDRFYYTTLPLPISLTKGKSEIQLEIRSQGRIWVYGSTWDKYQYNMTTASRSIYKVYTHTDAAFFPPKEELQGKEPVLAIRKSPGKEVIDQLKQRVNNEIKKLISSGKPLSQVQIQFLAKSYHVKWSWGYKDKELVKLVLWSLDELYKAYIENPKLAQADPATPNADWFGLGITGQVIWLLKEPLQNDFDNKIDDGKGNEISRRDGYIDMLLACRNWHKTKRRQYTNQSMINDLYGIYYANKGLQVLNAEKANKEEYILHYLYESVGLIPWTGSENSDGTPTFSQGKNYWQITPKGLTKELGFVGNYGEVIDWCVEIYDATRPEPDLPGDKKIKQQIEKIALARSYFRYPMPDDENYQSMRQEVVVGWRDTHYPGDVTYAQRPSWDGGPLQVVAATLRPQLIGYAQQMLNDNQFFSSVEQRMNDKGFRVTAGLLPVPDQYEIVKKQKPVDYKLPMSWDQPDFVFSDEEDAVIAIKNGREIVYASLYWRARNAVNNLARVHTVTPAYDRIATVFIDEKFDSSGLFYTIPDNTNFQFGNGGVKYPDGLHYALAGEKLPIAKIPEGIPYKAGQEHPLAGRADYYQLIYGNYFIAMNASLSKEFEVVIPDRFVASENLVTKEKLNNKVMIVKPQSTIVLYRKPL
ncbi:MAG: hypothetical protein QM725_11630 [Lacibacter sp.]